MSPKFVGYSFLVLTVFLWLALTYAAQIVQQVESLTDRSDEADYKKPFLLTYLALLGYAATGAVPVFYEVMRGRKRDREADTTPKIEMNIDYLRVDRPTVKVLAALSFFSVAYHYVWYLSLTRTSAAINLTLCNSISVFTAMLSWPLLNEKLNKGQIISGMIVMGGACWVSLSSGQSDDDVTTVGGCMLCLLASLLQACYGVFFKKLIRKNFPAMLFLFLMGTLGLALYWPVLLVLHLTGWETFELPPSSVAAVLLAVSLLCGTVFNWSMLRAVDCCSPTVVTVWLTISVPISAVIDWGVYGYVLSANSIFGEVMVIAAFVAFNMLGPKEEEHHSHP